MRDAASYPVAVPFACAALRAPQFRVRMGSPQIGWALAHEIVVQPLNMA
jgi:hypothetical protein